MQVSCNYMGINHDCKTELREVALRATPARLAILKLLEKTNKPLDVAMIRSYLEQYNIETDPATVFRIMNSFTERGLTKELHLNEGKARYELKSRDDHHHLICKNCGNIEDISDCNIDALEKDIEKKKKFKVTSHSLEFFGICSNCQK